ncbi:MAG: cytochrome P460 family protein [Nitrospira sp.]
MSIRGAVALPRRASSNQSPNDSEGLNVAVVRLLSVALDLSGGWSSAPPTAILLIPFGYRDWPSVTSTVESRSGAHTLRFYVSPKALLTPEYESFPVGTVFVVESEPNSVATGSSGARPSVFAMEKCAGLTMHGEGVRQAESWVYASWDSAGRNARADHGRCGVCRLPWLTPADFR